MKIKTLALAIAASTLPMTGAFAAAMDRSGQSISTFLEDGNYAEAGLSVLAPDVTGNEGGILPTKRDTGDVGDDFIFGHATIKLQPTDNFSVGLLYDQPFGAKASFKGQNAFVANSTDIVAIPGKQLPPVPLTTFASIDGETDVSVDSHSLTLLAGFQPTKNLNIYAGPVYQRVKGKVDLRGQASSLLSGYHADIPSSDAWGWAAGIAFQIPEIALKTSLTYHSKVDYDIAINENIPVLESPTFVALAPTIESTLGVPSGAVQGQLAKLGQSEKTKFSTPQSVNLEFQTGIMENTGIFANVRWVNWKDFAIRPYKYGVVAQTLTSLQGSNKGFNLVDYSKDQWSANLGIGRKINDKWAGSLSVGWDGGAGNPVTMLGPTDGYWNVGLGVKYNPAENYFVALGVKYFWLGDAKGQTGAQSGTDGYVAEFKDNTAIAGGLRIGYKF